MTLSNQVVQKALTTGLGSGSLMMIGPPLARDACTGVTRAATTPIKEAIRKIF